MQVRDICAILSGLVVAQDYRRGQALVVNRNFADNAEFFQVGRCCLIWLLLRGRITGPGCGSWLSPCGTHLILFLLHNWDSRQLLGMMVYSLKLGHHHSLP